MMLSVPPEVMLPDASSPALSKPSVHVDDVALKAREAGKCALPERVFRKVHAGRVFRDFQNVVSTEVGVETDPAAAPIDIVHFPGLDLVKHIVTGSSLRWKSIGHP